MTYYDNSGEEKAKYKNFREIENEYNKTKVACSHCGHRMAIGTADRKICTWCGNYIYRTPEIEFRYKIKERIINEKRKRKNIRESY